MKYSLIGPSYTAQSSAVADEECINWYAESIETPGAQTKYSYFRTPGLGVTVVQNVGSTSARGSCFTGTRCFFVVSDELIEFSSSLARTLLYSGLPNDGSAVSIAWSSTQLLIISAGRAFCYTLATNAMLEVTGQLAGVPIQAEYNDAYFIVSFENSNKFQYSTLEDGTSWPGINVNAVSVFADNIVSIKCDHRELWIWGSQHCQPYYDSGSSEVFDVISGAFIESGSAATFGAARADNTKFWVHQDERGGRQCWRASGYTPSRISTFAVENDLSSYADISGLVSYAYQDAGHLFWVLYIPGSQWSWTYDVSTGFWAKRATWNASTAQWGPHRSWNHVYAFGKHLVGDWLTGSVFEMNRNLFTEAFPGDDTPQNIRRLRRSPTLVNEMQWIYFQNLTLDFACGLGPQPPFVDGDGNPRQPQTMVRWSDDRGMNWSNEHLVDCGYAGQYLTRAILWRLGRSRYRVWEISVTDPIDWTLVDGYLNTE